MLNLAFIMVDSTLQFLECNGIKKNHADKHIKQNTCINSIYLVEASDWYAVMKLFVAQIFSSLVVVAECKQKSKDGCSVNHRLIKHTGRYFESRHKSHVNTNYYDELDMHLRQCQVWKFNSEISHSFYTQQTYMYIYTML